jgi:hypothetical protein
MQALESLRILVIGCALDTPRGGEKRLRNAVI